MISELDKAWLAGIIDGEGSITVARLGLKKTGKARYLKPMISIANTNTMIILEVKRIIDEIVGRNINVHQSNQYSQPCYSVWTASQFDIYRVCENVSPYLRGKREQAELMMEFIRKRVEKPYARYTDDHNSYGDRINSLNHRRYPPVETEWATPIHGLKRQSELREYVKAQSAAEMPAPDEVKNN